MIQNIESEHQTMAVLIPSTQIGKYAQEALNTINSFVIYKNIDYKVDVIDIITQNQSNIHNAIDKLIEQNVEKITALITIDNFQYLNNIENLNNMQIYLPLINRNDLSEPVIKSNFIFGAIDYKKQFEALTDYTNSVTLVDFYDQSPMGEALHNYIKDYNIVYKKPIDNNNGQYSTFLRNNKKIINQVIVLNTPIVKSSILLSQIYANNIKVKKIISTQLNYTPLIFSLTQKYDRDNMIIANSIGKIPDSLSEFNNMMNNSLQYNWVNYSVVLGLQYLIEGHFEPFEDITIKNNQIIYPVNLYEVTRNSFKRVEL